MSDEKDVNKRVGGLGSKKGRKGRNSAAGGVPWTRHS